MNAKVERKKGFDFVGFQFHMAFPKMGYRKIIQVDYTWEKW